MPRNGSQPRVPHFPQQGTDTNKPTILQFVDVSCTCRTVCSHRLHQIRSHVAKIAHNRRRQKALRAASSSKEKQLPYQVLNHNNTGFILDSRGRGRGRHKALREIKPMPQVSQPLVSTMLWPSIQFAWTLSQDEQFLFTFCKYLVLMTSS